MPYKLREPIFEACEYTPGDADSRTRILNWSTKIAYPILPAESFSGYLEFYLDNTTFPSGPITILLNIHNGDITFYPSAMSDFVQDYEYVC